MKVSRDTKGTSSKRMGDFVDIGTEVQRRSTEDLYTMTVRSVSSF